MIGKGKTRRLGVASPLVAFTAMLLLAGCWKDNQCDVKIGATNFSIEPNSAYYQRLNNVGGYEYITGGNLGIVVVRTAIDHFVAFERTCPVDDSVAVVFPEGWEGSLLECPKCHSKFIILADGMPMDGSATFCPLYQYSTTYFYGKLYISL